MTTNKPPIAAWAPNAALETLERRCNNAPCILTDSQGPGNDVALIRLTDHEADRAADKARIAELESALSECAASLAWNCFGECRAIHAGPIMPAAQALETAREALATHRKGARYD